MTKNGPYKKPYLSCEKRLDSNTCRKSLRTIDLNKKCYRKITVQSIKEDQKSIRKTCCQWIRKNIDSSKLERMMLTNEKIFTKNGYFNPKNAVIWADDRSDANERDGLHSMEKYPVCVMVALCATWYRPPFF